MESYLTNIQTVIFLDLEWTHLDFAYELGANDGLRHHERNQLAHMRQDELCLVVSSGVEGGQGQSSVLEISLFEHGMQHVDDNGLEVFVVCLISVGERVAECGDDHAADLGIAISQEYLFIS